MSISSYSPCHHSLKRRHCGPGTAEESQLTALNILVCSESWSCYIVLAGVQLCGPGWLRTQSLRFISICCRVQPLTRLFCSFNFFFKLACVGEHERILAQAHSTCVEVRGQFCEVSSPFTFTRVLGLTLRSLDLCSQYFCLA